MGRRFGVVGSSDARPSTAVAPAVPSCSGRSRGRINRSPPEVISGKNSLKRALCLIRKGIIKGYKCCVPYGIAVVGAQRMVRGPQQLLRGGAALVHDAAAGGVGPCAFGVRRSKRCPQNGAVTTL